MQSSVQLAFAILRSEPDAAARLLESSPAASVAVFLQNAPQQERVTVLARMLPVFGAEVLRQFPRELAVSCLQDMASADIAALLRQLDADQQDSMLAALPWKKQTTCRVLLRYGAETVGGWMDTDFLVVNERATAGEALALVKKRGASPNASTVYVLNRQRQLVGLVPVARLLRSASANSVITALMQPASAGIRGRTTLSAALGHELWRERDALPVLGPGGEMIGLLPHHRLRHAQRRAHSEQRAPKTVLGEVAGAYGASLLAVVRAFNLETAGDTTAPAPQGNRP